MYTFYVILATLHVDDAEHNIYYYKHGLPLCTVCNNIIGSD